MKKVLVVHNKYQNIGEDISVYEEIKLLSKFYNVETIYFENRVDNIFSLLLTFIFSNNPSIFKFLKIKLENLNRYYLYSQYLV